MPSADLVDALLAIEGHPWKEMGKSRKPLTQNGLARINSINSSVAASSLSGTVRPERLRGLQVDPDQLLRGRGTRSNTEWGTVRFLKVEECHECHGGCRHNEECGRYFVACAFHKPSRHEGRQATEQTYTEVIAERYRGAAH